MKEIRRKLRNGVITPPEKFGAEDITWTGGIDYRKINLLPESVKWWVSCMGFLRALFLDDYLSEDDERVCRTIIEDWRCKNPIEYPASSRSWDGHAVAFRSEILTEVSKRSRNDGYLLDILTDHLKFLADECNFQGAWNHGVDQATALINLAQYMECEQSKELGVDRLEAALDILVDSQGVTREQSIHYQLYNLKQIERSINLLSGISSTKNERIISSLISRKEAMKTFLAHATRPDGKYSEIGDTPLQAAESLSNSDAEYAASMGMRGHAPLEKVKVYEAGYIFGRSGWGEIRRFQDETHYSLRFGPPRIIHGHNDHCSILYFTRGREVLRDGGFHGYTDDDTRQLLRLAESHNSVTVSKPALGFIGRETILSCSVRSGAWQMFSFLSHPYDDVSHKRTVIFSRTPEAFIILDEIRSTQDVTASQRWHFGNSFSLQISDGASASSEDGLFTVRQHYPFEEMRLFNTGDDDNPSTVAGDRMYEVTKCPLLVTQRTGRNVSFLTSFSFSSEAGVPQLEHQKSAIAGVRRSLRVSDREAAVELRFLENGGVTVEHFPIGAHGTT